MKIKELTKEQKERIEKYEVGKEVLAPDMHLPIKEIKRTIKRIEGEIEIHLENLQLMRTSGVLYGNNELVTNFKGDCYEKIRDYSIRGIKDLKQKLEDFKLMGELE